MPISGIAPFNVQFTDISNGTGTAWAWQFGDGSTSTSQNPTHAYTTPGTYTVFLTITTPNGVASHTDTVTVGWPIWSDLVAYWKMDETSGSRADSYGSYTLSEVGTVGFNGGADLTGGYLVNASSAPALTEAFTFSFWFRSENDDDVTGPVLLYTSEFLVMLVQHRFYAEVSAGWSGGSQAVWPAGVIDDGAWHHAVVWVDPDTDMFVHCSVDNGATSDSSSALSGSFTSLNPTYLEVGSRLEYLASTQPGLQIRNAAWFNSVLTSTERGWLYSAGYTGEMSSPVTTAWTPSAASMGTPGYDPQVMLRLSNDGGKNWISEQWRSAGKQGEYEHRVRWNRLGMARRRVFEVSVTDPIPWRITGAYLKMRSSKKG